MHSYRGETGKTSIIINLAEYLASMGKKICLVDFDLRSPSLLSHFSVRPRCYINDFLEERCRDINDVLVDIDGFSDNLCLAFASSDIKDIKESMMTDRIHQIRILNRLLNGRDSLKDKMDYLLLDTVQELDILQQMRSSSQIL
ncbi:tyrosine-protein kinase family protein [Candidatus Methanoliparum sp. LAM-1]|uniref:tyrosine-protein kinase family protein n=1 Tax=Candidatus Methanoliparum sp. LAM-1 TaxID=2874846 RepID=UPI00226CA737|nr:AAA family ATPase [Candidatus Methanoliparum sp. LAM-1]